MITDRRPQEGDCVQVDAPPAFWVLQSPDRARSATFRQQLFSGAVEVKFATGARVDRRYATTLALAEVVSAELAALGWVETYRR